MDRKTLLAVLVIFLLQVSSFSQEKIGSLSLNLRDQNGDRITVGSVLVKDKNNNEVLMVELSEPNTSQNLKLGFGKYVLTVHSPGFVTYQKEIDIDNDFQVIDIVLEIENLSVNVEVTQDKREKRLDESFSSFLSNQEINNLPETGEEIREELKRKYGDNVLIRIDGDFDGSQIPPRNQIASIKVIRNPFDAEFHEVANVIIDIRTKVASNGFNGIVRFSFNNSILNARNPFDPQRLPGQETSSLLSLSGPIIKNKTAFNFAMISRNNSDTQNFLGVLPNESDITTRKLESQFRVFIFNVKHNLPNEHLLNFRYQFSDISFFRLGVFDLPERSSTYSIPRHSFSITESGIIRNKYLNEITLEIGKESRINTSESNDRTIIVLDAFNSGSAGLNSRDSITKFRLADNLSFDVRKHSLKIGTEIKYEQLDRVSENNLNGRFIFSNFQDFENQSPSQFTQTLSSSEIDINQLQTSLYLQDYFKVTKDLQLSLGLRYEWQNNLGDTNNFSPRIGYVWSPEKSGKFIIRGGFGIFYEWLDSHITSSILVNDGEEGQSIIIANPGFPDPFNDEGALRSVIPNISRLAENLESPKIYVVQTGFNYKPSKFLGLDGIYTFKRGLNHFRSRDINAPLNGIRPNPSLGLVQLLESSGKSTENSFEIKVNNYFRGVNIYTNYRISMQVDDFSSALSLPTDSYDLTSDRGFSDLDQRHKLNVGLNFNVWNIKFSPNFRLESAFPYTITTGRDNNMNTVFNDRPFGIQRNSERGEWLTQTNLQMQWKLPINYFGLGKEGKRSINMTTNINNIFNHTNLRNYSGVQTSPFFRQAKSASDPRSIDLGISFIF